MSKSAIQQLDVDAQVAKRAQWEAFEFTLLGEGQVEVRNESYPDEEVYDHTYIVEVEDGEMVNCSCPYSEYHEGECKHIASIAIRAPLFEAVTASEGSRLTADGGAITTDTNSDLESEACPNGDPQCDGGDSDALPCFDCYERTDTEEGDR